MRKIENGMNHKMISCVILMSLFIVTISNLTVLSTDYKNTDSMVAFSVIKSAYAQSTPSDNSTDLGVPSDDPLSDLGLSDNSTNSTSQTTSIQNPPPGATTPEFGNLAPIILVISIVSILVISTRNRLGFH